MSHVCLKGQSTSNWTESSNRVMATGGSDVVVTTGGNQEEEKEEEREEGKVCTISLMPMVLAMTMIWALPDSKSTPQIWGAFDKTLQDFAPTRKMDLVNCLFHFRSSVPEYWCIVFKRLMSSKIAFHIACQGLIAKWTLIGKPYSCLWIRLYGHE